MSAENAAVNVNASFGHNMTPYSSQQQQYRRDYDDCVESYRKWQQLPPKWDVLKFLRRDVWK